MIPPTSIDGTDITGATIDGQDVEEITVDGQTVFTAGPAGAFDLTNFTFNQTYSGFGTSLQEMRFENSGNKLFTIPIKAEVREFDLTTPFDPSGRTEVSDASIGDDVRGIAFNDDGTRLIWCEQDTGDIEQYTLSNPYDLDTISFDTRISADNGQPTGIEWNDDGTKLIEAGRSPDRIAEFSVSVAYDIGSTLTLESRLSTSDEVRDVAFGDDGSFMYVVNSTTDSVFQTSLSTPYDISTNDGLSSVLSVSSQTSDPTGCDFNADGSKFFVSAGTDIHEYTL